MKPTLLILAAGMGSRYGGLKQLDRFGPSGETIMDYAIYDALAAGFGKVVFVIRHGFESDFRRMVGGKYEKRVTVDYVFQELDELPTRFSAPAERSRWEPSKGSQTLPRSFAAGNAGWLRTRSKPWGTAHAIWCARKSISEPFVSINADDYYGKSAFRVVAQHLLETPRPAQRGEVDERSEAGEGLAVSRLEAPSRAGELPEYCLVGYPVLQTLSEHGTVARAICDVDEAGFLEGLVERIRVEKSGDSGKYVDETGTVRFLKGDEVVSMNMLGFQPAVFDQLERHLIRFLESQRRTPDNSECLIPVVLGELLKEKAAKVRVLPTSDAWFGVTHQKDKQGATETLAKMVKRGDYPSPIWSMQ